MIKLENNYIITADDKAFTLCKIKIKDNEIVVDDKGNIACYDHMYYTSIYDCLKKYYRIKQSDFVNKKDSTLEELLEFLKLNQEEFNSMVRSLA